MSSRPERPRYAQHARARLALRRISPDEVQAVLGEPDAADVTPDVVRYHRVVEGRALRVIVKRESIPPLVITAKIVEDE